VLPRLGHAAATAAGAATLLIGSTIVSRSASSRRLWLYGWRRPGGAKWLLPAAMAAVLALPLRGLFPAPDAWTPAGVGIALGGIALLALALETSFRGLVYGMLLRHKRLANTDAPARLTEPARASALLYALVVTGLCLPAIWGAFHPVLPPVEETLLVFVTAFGAGLLLARARERSLSLWPGAAAQLVGGIASAGLAALLLG
jgi:hypothetical protein